MVMPFQLEQGHSAPRQQSSTTCGAAALTVARMLSDPWFARWIQHGLPREAGVASGDTGETGDAADTGSAVSALKRFAAYERRVTARTNSLFTGSRPQLPWPRALGTPPWGAGRELQLVGGSTGAARARYSVRPVRLSSPRSLDAVFIDLCARVAPGRPALLYIGSRTLPRHVVLVLPTSSRHELVVYEPSSGQVLGLTRRGFVTRRLALAGWDVPWAAVWAEAT